VDNSIINHGQLQDHREVIRVDGGEINVLNTGHITRTGHDTAASVIVLSAVTDGTNSDNIRNVINAGIISTGTGGFL